MPRSRSRSRSLSAVLTSGRKQTVFLSAQASAMRSAMASSHGSRASPSWPVAQSPPAVETCEMSMPSGTVCAWMGHSHPSRTARAIPYS